MASTYEPIANTTLSSNASSITFSSIPSTYTDLVLIMNFNQDAGGAPTIQFNNDTSTSYSETNLVGDGSSASSHRETSVSNYYCFDYIATSTSVPNTSIIQIMNYSNTTTYKSLLERANVTTGGTGAIVGLWRNTAAINKIFIGRQTAGNYTSGSQFTLYGIKASA
jgi:hypothetical protein